MIHIVDTVVAVGVVVGGGGGVVGGVAVVAVEGEKEKMNMKFQHDEQRV
jgi:hypothetical protein